MTAFCIWQYTDHAKFGNIQCFQHTDRARFGKIMTMQSSLPWTLVILPCDPWPFPTTSGSRPPTIELDCGKVPLGCKANSGRAARLQGCRATRLQGYRATGLHTSETSFMSDSCRTYPSG